MHEYLAWIGSVLILVHAGIHFNALLPWVAILMLLINVASGLVGKFFLKNASLSLNESRQEYIASGIISEEAEKKLFFDTITVNAMKKMEGRAFTYCIYPWYIILIAYHNSDNI